MAFLEIVQVALQADEGAGELFDHLPAARAEALFLAAQRLELVGLTLRLFELLADFEQFLLLALQGAVGVIALGFAMGGRVGGLERRTHGTAGAFLEPKDGFIRIEHQGVGGAHIMKGKLFIYLS